jgi:xylose dehydrogenase (NAD/NADP)
MTPRAELEVIGDAGMVVLPDPWHSVEPRIELRREQGTEVIEVEPRNPYACELEDFAAAVAGERPHRFARDDAVGQARTIAALYRSAEFGADAVP